MKLRFWQKTYIFTLIIFLLCLNCGILSLALHTYSRSVSSAESSVSSQQYYLGRSFERDLEDTDGSEEEAKALMERYSEFYGSQGFLMEFVKDGEVICSNISQGLGVSKNSVAHKDIFGKRYIIVSSNICEDTLTFNFAKNSQDIVDEYHQLVSSYVITALAVSVFLAIVLYLVLRRLSLPLDKLRKVTERIEGGDYTVRASETGRDEFTLLAKSFNSMLERIAEQMNRLELEAQKKQLLVDNMAHELRTPMTSIYGYAEYLEKAASSEEDRVISARYIMSETKRLQKISQMLLDEAYIRGSAPQMTPVNVGKVLDDVKEKLERKASLSGVTLELEPMELTVNGNETLLSMLFYNLTENAIKACNKGGKVTLYAQNMRVFVKDNGKGMNQTQLEHITEPFYRTDKSRARAEGGAGLGLALCRQIVQTHGTELEFKSELGVGTEVSVDFTN